MKLAIQYLNDSKGNVKAVQLALSDWNKLVQKIKKYEQELKLKSNLTQAFKEVDDMRKGSAKKQSLSDFLNGL